MTYSLVGAPAVGFDLARLPGGARVAAVLRTALLADARDLSLLAVRHPGAARTSWQEACDGVGTTSVGQALRDVAPTLGDPVAAGAVLRELEGSLLGDVAALRRLVSYDLLDHTWIHSGALRVQDPEGARAAEVLSDCAVAAYLGTALPDATRRAMALPFMGARLVVRDESVPCPVPGLEAPFEQLLRADEDVRTAWRSVVDAQRGRTAAWAPAMHRATHTLHLTDRLRTAFDAQMAAVTVFARAGFTARDAAYGAWNALSGVVQATVVGDALPRADADVLLAPWRAVHEI